MATVGTTYVGQIENDEHRVYVLAPGTNMKRMLLPHLVRHSPDGFCWGYHGSGPADLALAICAHTLNYTPAPAVYQRLKDRLIAPLDMNRGFTISQEDVLRTLEDVRQDLGGVTCLRCMDRGILDLSKYCSCAEGQKVKEEIESY